MSIEVHLKISFKLIFAFFFIHKTFYELRHYAEHNVIKNQIKSKYHDACCVPITIKDDVIKQLKHTLSDVHMMRKKETTNL